MPRQHEVTFSGPRKTPLESSAIFFEVKLKGEDLGDLHIRRGGVDWKPTGAHYRRGLSWQELAELAMEKGRPVRN